MIGMRIMATLAITVSFGAILLAACGGGGNVSLHAAPLWIQVSDKATCATAGTACSGYYGFVIDDAGNYTAGPNAQGQTLKGTVTKTEWNQLQSAADALANDIAASPDALCKAQQFPAGVSDLVQIVAAGRLYSVQDGANELCAYGGSTADSIALIDLVDTLRAKYYSF